MRETWAFTADVVPYNQIVPNSWDNPMDALWSGQGTYACLLKSDRVEESYEAYPVLLRYAADYALQVAELWECSGYVVEYLQDPINNYELGKSLNLFKYPRYLNYSNKVFNANECTWCVWEFASTRNPWYAARAVTCYAHAHSVYSAHSTHDSLRVRLLTRSVKPRFKEIERSR